MLVGVLDKLHCEVKRGECVLGTSLAGWAIEALRNTPGPYVQPALHFFSPFLPSSCHPPTDRLGRETETNRRESGPKSMRPPIARAIRAIRPRKRYASTATQRTIVPAPIPSASSGVAPPQQPLIHELEGLYGILEGQVGGDPVWSERVLSAVEQLRNPGSEVRVGGTSPPSSTVLSLLVLARLRLAS